MPRPRWRPSIAALALQAALGSSLQEDQLVLLQKASVLNQPSWLVTEGPKLLAELQELQEQQEGDLAFLQVPNSTNATNKTAAESISSRYLKADHVVGNDDALARPYLLANSRAFIDFSSMGLIAVVAVISLSGYFMGGVALLMPTMVFASYLILIPGLFYKDFSFSIAVKVQDFAASLPAVKALGFMGNVLLRQLPKRLLLTSHISGGNGPVRESTRSLVKLLWTTDSHTGAICIACFAFVVPLLKLFCLGLAELWRHHPSPGRVKTARYLIIVVQMISKWAAPDMYCFALLYYLLRILHKPPLTESLQVLDFGFSCYNIFCVASAVSTLFVKLPDLPRDAQEAAQKVEEEQNRARRAILDKCGGQTFVIGATGTCFVTWAVLFCYGLFQPVLSLHLDMQSVLASININRTLLNMVKQVVDFNTIEKMIGVDVSFWRATTSFWNWFFTSYEFTLLMAFVMLGVFCILITVVDMVLLLIAACLASSKSAHQQLLQQVMQATVLCRHLSMVDVCMVGILVVKFAAKTYTSSGIVINPMYGTWIFLGTEAIHYATYYFVKACVRVLQEDTSNKKLEKC